MVNRLFHVVAVVAAAAALFISCSSDTEFPDEPNMEYINTLARSSESVTYKLSGWNYFTMPAGTDRWTEEDLSQIAGLYPNIPERVIFSKGQVWTPISLFSPISGPSEFSSAWDAYKKVTGQPDLNLYLSVDFEYDADNKSMKIATSDYDVLKFEPSEIVLSKTGHYYGGEGGKGGNSMSRYYLVPSEQIEINRNTDLGFESEHDAYAYILKCAHEVFGDTINLNEVYAPDVIFDNPYVDLNKLEESLGD